MTITREIIVGGGVQPRCKKCVASKNFETYIPSESERSKRLERINKNWGEGFVEVVTWMRGSGYTWKTIAELLEIPYPTLKRWVSKTSLGDNKYNREAPYRKILNERAKLLGYKDLTDMLRTYRYEGKTHRDVAKDLECSDHTPAFTSLAPKELSGEYELTDRLIKIRRKNMNRVNRLGKNKTKEWKWK